MINLSSKTAKQGIPRSVKRMLPAMLEIGGNKTGFAILLFVNHFRNNYKGVLINDLIPTRYQSDLITNGDMNHCSSIIYNDCIFMQSGFYSAAVAFTANNQQYLNQFNFIKE